MDNVYITLWSMDLFMERHKITRCNLHSEKVKQESLKQYSVYSLGILRVIVYSRPNTGLKFSGIIYSKNEETIYEMSKERKSTITIYFNPNR